jgi:hypothetical protein
MKSLKKFKIEKSKKYKSVSMRKSLGEIRKPTMLLSKDKAREVASDWHGGQWSALYQFASSGEYVPGYQKKYLFEIAENIPLASYTQKRLLKKLKSWFVYKSKQHKKSQK